MLGVMPQRTTKNVQRLQTFLRLLIAPLHSSARWAPRVYGPQSHSSSLLYRVQVVFESTGHAGDQVNVVVHTAAHAALHQRADGWLLGARVKQILRFVVAVHRAPGEAVLRGQRHH